MRHTLTERFVPSAHLFFDLMHWFGASAYHHLLFFWAEVVNRAPTMILFSSKGESELDTPFVIPYLLCQIVLIFAKLNRPRKCWRWCLSRFVYIFPWLLNSLQNYLANSLSWGIYLRYRERTWNGLETEVERTWDWVGFFYDNAKLLRFPRIKKSMSNFLRLELC